MSESFKVTRRFFDDKNYPRGFSRHGDYTIKESQVLEQYGQAFKDLEEQKRKPVTKEERDFVAVCCNKKEATTFFEKTWQKYRSKTSASKRVYTLSAVVGVDNLEDFSTE